MLRPYYYLLKKYGDPFSVLYIFLPNLQNCMLKFLRIQVLAIDFPPL